MCLIVTGRSPIWAVSLEIVPFCCGNPRQGLIVILEEMKRSALVLTVLAALLSGCAESGSSPASSSVKGVECQLPPESEQALPDSDFVLMIAPKPVASGMEVDLVIKLAEDAPDDLRDAHEEEIITGAGALLQCWDGSAWVDTHRLLKDGFGPDTAPAAIGIGSGVTVTIPDVGLSIGDQPYTIVAPDLPSGIYRVEDTVIVGSSGRSVFSLLEIQDN